MPYENILVKTADRVGWIILNRPDRLNAITRAALTGLRGAAADMLPDEAVGVMILTGAGDKAFTSGVRPS